MSGHLVDSKSSKFLLQKVLTKATFRIGFYCLEKKFSRSFLISRIYTNYMYSRDKVYDHLEVENCVDDGSNVRNGHG